MKVIKNLFLLIILALFFFSTPSPLTFHLETAVQAQDTEMMDTTPDEEERERQIKERREQIKKAMEEQQRRRALESEQMTKPDEKKTTVTEGIEAEEPSPSGTGQEEPKPQVSGAEEALSDETDQEQVTPPPFTAPRPAIAPGTVSFFFDDADVFEVIQTVFGDVLKENYIVDPQIKGRVNFRTVTPIPKEEVLPIMEIILRLNGIGFVEEKGLYNIVPLDKVSKELVYAQIGRYPEEVAIELFTFKNVDLKESMLDIENALGLNIKGGTVRILPVYRLNALLVVASSKLQLDYIRKWIAVFDEMFMTARPKIYVYPLQNSKADHIASLLQSIFSGSTSSVSSAASTARTSPSSKSGMPSSSTSPASAAPKVGASTVASGAGFLVSADTRIFSDEVSNALIILATPSDYDFIEETIKKLDTVPRQVLIEGLIARVDLSDSLQFGFAWALRTDIRYDRWGVDLSTEIAQNPGTLLTDPAELLSTAGFTLIGWDPTGIVRTYLEALASEGKAEVIASPHILIADNREASFQVGQQIPIPTSETNVTGTTNIQRTFQYKDIGIILKVKPQINESGIVSLELTQEVSSSATPIEEISTGAANPVINKIEATTYLVAKNKETIIIGGLIREDTSKSRTGIPLLKDIPILGYLFGTTTESTDRVELVILLTPHVITSLDEAKQATDSYVDKYRATEKLSIEELLEEKFPRE
jgi:type II secretion system protein D